MGEATDRYPERRERTVSRFVSFTDGVVAVAITLLALPLVQTLPKPGQTALDVVADNTGPLLAFLFTFAVVAIMWSAHNRILNGMRDYDGAIFWLNTAWLALIVLLPWVSDMYGDSEVFGNDDGAPGAGLLYWSALSLLSLIGWLMGWHLGRRPDLLVESETAGGAPRGLIFAGFFLIIGIASVLAPPLGAWLPLGIIPLSIWLRPARTA